MSDAEAFCFCLVVNFLVWAFFFNGSPILHFKIFVYVPFGILLRFLFLFLKGLVSFHFYLISLSLSDCSAVVLLAFKNKHGNAMFAFSTKEFY